MEKLKRCSQIWPHQDVNSECRYNNPRLLRHNGVVLACTSKLCVGLFDVTQSCDQLLAGDWLLILQQIPAKATQIITFIYIFFFVPLEPFGCSKNQEYVSDCSLPLCYKSQLIGQYIGI